MSIKYKKIIEEIMGEEAKKRGFSIKSHPKLIATKPLGILERTVDERNQSLFITEDLIHKGDIYIMFEGKRMTYHYEDEETFRMAISQINEFMLREGYSKMDEWLKRPFLKKADREYLKNNYSELYQKYQNLVGEKTLRDDILNISEMINSLTNKEWVEVKKELIDIMGITAGIILNKIPNTYMYDSDDYFYMIREEGLKRKALESPENMVLSAYRLKDNKWIETHVKRYLSETELHDFDSEIR